MIFGPGRFWWIGVLGGSAACLATTARPSTEPAPAVRTSTPLADPSLPKWFADVCSTDPVIRERARTHLLQLTSAQVPALQTLLKESGPLQPEQRAVLHDVVVQAFLSGDIYPSCPGGFLGLRWPDAYAGQDELPRFGVSVEIRLEGFPGFADLQEGDIILGVLVEPDLPLSRWPNMRTTTHQMLTEAVKQAAAGRKIELQVLRCGESVRIPLQLAVRPLVDNVTADTLFEGRVQRAETFWQREFVPLLKTS